MKLNRSLFFAGLVGLMSACSSDSPEEVQRVEKVVAPTRGEIELTESSKRTLASLEEYNLRITNDYIGHHSTAAYNANGNAVLSPLSIQMLLSLLVNGVEGDYCADLLQYMNVENVADLNYLSETLLKGLPTVDTSSTMVLANGGWFNDKLTLTEEMKGILESSYQAEWSYQDYSADNVSAVLSLINEWVEEKTSGKIKHPIDEILPDIALTLVNTVYFKSSWSDNAFDAKLTKKSIFHGTNGDSKVDMMTAPALERDYTAMRNGTEAFRMDFGNRAYYLTVVMLPKGENPDRLPEECYEVIKDMPRYNLTVNLPKFKVYSKQSLNSVLDDSALKSLKGIVPLTMFTSPTLFSFGIEHHACFEVDEKGCEAAAVTFTGGYGASTEPLQDVTVTVDRPFWFFINERSTGACMLSGKINNL